MARSAVETIALLRTVETPKTVRAPICAHLSRPAIFTVAAASYGIARATILTRTL